MNPNQNDGGADVHYSQPPAKKSSWVKWLLGCGCGCLLILGGTMLAFFLMGRSMFDTLKESAQRGRTQIERQAQAGDAITFVNSPNKLDGKLKENYVDFTFNYPKDWTFDSRAGIKGSSNFAEVDYSENDYTHEHFIVGYFRGAFEKEELVSELANKIADGTLSSGFGKAKKLGEKYSRFGKYEGYELRTEHTVKGTEGTPIKFWIKTVLVKNPKSEKGVMVIMYATDRSEQVKSIDDVGVVGDLPEIIESFQFTN